MSTAVDVRNILDLFFDQLSQTAKRVLLLDYDGTIAPFSVHRNQALPYPTVPELLDCIMSTCNTRVVLTSGRPAREIPPLLGINPHPEVWGTHGIERLHADGRYVVAAVSQNLQDAFTEADARLRKEGLDRLTELKLGAVAVHWRGLPPGKIEEVKARVYRLLSSLARQNGVLLEEFDGGLELRARTPNKGDIVQIILSEVGGDAAVACLGDDVSDEDAFRALNGKGLTVLVRPTGRPTAAQSWIRPPAELIQFLTDWLRACRGDM